MFTIYKDKINLKNGQSFNLTLNQLNVARDFSGIQSYPHVLETTFNFVIVNLNLAYTQISKKKILTYFPMKKINKNVAQSFDSKKLNFCSYVRY